MTEIILAYLPVAIAFGIAPGPDATLAMRTSLAHGVRQGVAVALGAATGSVAWGVAAAIGLASFLTRFPAAFDVLRWAGAIYLVILGIISIRSAGKWSVPDGNKSSTVKVPLSRAFLTGLVADLLNPKMGIFYLAIIPQFIPKDGPIFLWSIILMSIEFVVAIICLSLYAGLASSLRKFLKKGSLAAWLDRSLGLVLLGFGVRVAAG
jgi:threonine/homoserine/homoserine lactone efflux protein